MRLRALIAALAAATIVATPLVGAGPASAATLASGSTASLSELLADLRVAPPLTASYQRDLFFEGQDLDRDGCRTRQEVLIEESRVAPTVTAPCTIITGEWYSSYDGATHVDPAAVEMDHLVALKETWVSGAASWTDAQRTAYANETDFPATLAMVTAAVNTAKSDKDPSSWLPPLSSAQCGYVSDWLQVKWRWNLAVDESERDAIGAVVDRCNATSVVVPDAPALGRPADPAPTAPGGKTEIAPFPSGTTRLSGASRYDTAIEVSRRYAAGVPAVFVATGTDFPDALSAAAAAALVGGPLLLTTPTALPAGVRQEIARLAPAQIFVIGGTGAVTPTVARALEAIAPVTRLAGTDRYTTGRTIVDSVFPSASTVFVATGASFPDALAATGAAGAVKAPVLLVRGTQPKLDEATLTTIARLGATDVVIAGGAGAVSAGIAAQLNGLHYSVSRFGGASRYDTAALINSSFFPQGSTQTMLLATGTNFPDALAGAAMAGRIGAPMYITTAACVPSSVRGSIDSLSAPRRVVMGGSAVVSTAAAANTGCLTAGTPSISGSPRVNSTLTVNPGSWTPGTAFSYQWFANGAAIRGASGTSFRVSDAVAGKRISVTVTGSQAGYVSASKSSAATSAVGYPSRTAPTGALTCPSWAPIKGNASSMIYHVPGGQYYAITGPEECFRTEAAAVAAGYRKSKR